MSESTALVPVDANVFLAFDRLDDMQIVAEMKGACLEQYVYRFSEGGQTVVGLSKKGTDDATRLMAVRFGEALRELDCEIEAQDENDAFIRARVSRVVIKEDGSEFTADTAFGHKRQSKWINLRNGNRKPNLFWYEQGTAKALRNARQRMMPEPIKQQIIQEYVKAGKVRDVSRQEVEESAEFVRDEQPTNGGARGGGKRATPQQPEPAKIPKVDMPEDFPYEVQIKTWGEMALALAGQDEEYEDRFLEDRGSFLDQMNTYLVLKVGLPRVAVKPLLCAVTWGAVGEVYEPSEIGKGTLACVVRWLTALPPAWATLATAFAGWWVANADDVAKRMEEADAKVGDAADDAEVEGAGKATEGTTEGTGEGTGDVDDLPF